MEYRFLGGTGLRVSRLVLGTMGFGNGADEAASRSLYDCAREAGINTFDTSDVYSDGLSERWLGSFIAKHRDEVVLASKAYFPTGSGPNDRGLSRYHLIRAVEASLRRLGTERIDLYYLHRHDDMAEIDEVWRAVDDLVTQGKILYPAISNFSAWQGMKAVARTRERGWAKPVCFQPMYNLVKRQVEVEILPMCVSEGLGVMPYSPTGAGLLSGKYTTRSRPTSGRLVDNKMYRARYSNPEHFEVAEKFSQLASEVGAEPASLAIAWVAAHPAITAPIVGATSTAHLNSALGALDIKLDYGDELYRRISSLAPEPPPATDRNEESTSHNFGSR